MSAGSHLHGSDPESNNRVEAAHGAKSSMWMQLDLLTVMQAAINAAVELTGLDTGAIYLLQENVLYLGATTPALPADFPDELRYADALDHPHLMHSVDTGTPLVLDDMTQEDLTEQERRVAEVRGIRSILYVPLFSLERPIGVFMVGSVDERRSIPQSDISVSQALAESISHAIEDAHLFDTLIHHSGEVPSDVRERLRALVATKSGLEDNHEKRRIEQLQHRLQRRLTLLQIRDRLLRDEIENAQAVHSRSLSALEDELDSFQRLLSDTRDELMAFTTESGEHALVESGLEEALRHLLSQNCPHTRVSVFVAPELDSADLDTTLLTYRASRSLVEALCLPSSTKDVSLRAEASGDGRICLSLELTGPRDTLPSQRSSASADLNAVATKVKRAGGELELVRQADKVIAKASLPFFVGA